MKLFIGSAKEQEQFLNHLYHCQQDDEDFL
jgi:hypothetical protein